VSDTRLQHVVDAISDGERVDWAAVRRRFSDPTNAEYCKHLETVSKIGQLTQDSASFQQDTRESRWVSVLMVFAFLQIAFGIVGAILYREHTFVNNLRLLTVLAFAGAGLILRLDRKNVRARDLGAAFALRAVGFSNPPFRLLFSIWLSGTALITLQSGLALESWMPLFIWRFARRFPETSRFTTIDRIAIAFTNIAGVVGAVLFAINLWIAFTHPTAGVARTFGRSYEDGTRYFATTVALILPALPIVLIRARSAASVERSRVRVFSIAMVAGTTPICIELILEALVPAYVAFLRGSERLLTAMVITVLVPLVAVPLVTGYSVLVHHLLDTRLVIRKGVRYLLAKWTLAAMMLTPFGFVAWHVYVRRNDTVANVVSDRRGVLLLLLVAVGSALFVRRKYLIGLLDRWFDRTEVDRTIVLARTGDALRLVRTRSELAASIEDAAQRGLKASAIVHFFDPRRQAYVPLGRGSLSLPVESALGSMLTQQPTLSLVRTDRDTSIARYLPRTERFWLNETDVSAVVPIRSTGVERPAGLIAFGPRRDAMGYSREDEQFVTALASATGIALENLRLKSEVTEGDDEFGMLCERCRRVVDAIDGTFICGCGGDLKSASVPRRINGKFLVEALLGAGGMGVVYLASDTVLNRQVALKTLPSVSAEAMARLSREARTMAALTHPHLATILGQESWRGTPILVCEYLPRGTLQQRLARGPLGVNDALSLTLAILDALDYMHGQALLHRDIKPSNIAFAVDGTPKLLDFGLAELMERAQAFMPADALTTPSAVGTILAGTIAYLPPAAFRGETPTVLFDLWALTVVLFEAITGRHPFAAGVDTAENICRGRLNVSIEENPDIPEAVRYFLREALTSHSPRWFESSTALREAVTTIRAAHSQ
jgi:hypothetical protein